MRIIATIAFCLMVLALNGIAQAQMQGTMASPMGQMMGAGPGGMSEMMKMCMSMMPAITVDANAVYVVRGDQVYKLSKDNLTLLSVSSLPMQQAPGAMSQPGIAGRGGGMMMLRPQMNTMMQQMRQMQPSQFERSFLLNMIRHHQGAILMSRIALAKATHPELREFAQKTIDGQGLEQQQYGSWLKSWYKTSAVKQPTQMDSEITANLNTLSGRDFEISFMRDMITHHAEAVQMAQDAEQKAVHSQVKTAASQIATQQSNEIIQLQNWLSSWYGVDAGSK